MQVKFISLYYTDDQVYDGDLAPEVYEDAHETIYDVCNVEEACDLIARQGLTFESTGTDWAANPDGPRIINYETGMREEVTGHLIGSDSFKREVIERVG